MAEAHGGPDRRPDREEVVLLKLHHLGSVLQAQRIRGELDEIVSAGHGRIALDMCGLDYAGAVAAAAVVAGYAKRAPPGVRIGIVAAEPAVTDMLDRSGFSELLGVYVSVEDATAGCGDVLTADADYDPAQAALAHGA